MCCFAHFDLQMCLAPQRRAIFGHRKLEKCPVPVSFSHFHLKMCFAPQWRAIFWTSDLQKSGPNVWCFAHFDLQMCFAPQWRTIFGHVNFEIWSAIVVLCAFWLENVLRATAACHFCGSEKAKSVPEWGALFILAWKCASRHSGVPFFISLLNNYLRTRRFSEPTFRTSGTTNHWKNTAIRDVPNISRTCTFFLLTLRVRWSSFYWLYTRVDLLSANVTSLLLWVFAQHASQQLSSALQPPVHRSALQPKLARPRWVSMQTEFHLLCSNVCHLT